MQLTVHAAIAIDGSEFGKSAVLPYDLAKQILQLIHVTDEPLLAGPLGIGDDLAETIEMSPKYQIRKDAVKALSDELAKLLIEQVGKHDTINGWPVVKEST